MAAIAKSKTTQIGALAKEFGDHMKGAANRITKAAHCYVKAIQVDTSAIDVFRDKYPTVPTSVWSGFCRIAAGELHPQLLFDGTPGGRALTKCDMVTQTSFMDEGIPIATASGDTLLVSARKMTYEQAKQVFCRGRIRDIAEQRAWIESMKMRSHISTRKAINTENQIYVEKGKLNIGDVKLTRADLLRFLAQMEDD